MENPATWSEAERIIAHVLEEFRDEKLQKEPIIGLSLPRRIADALRQAGLLQDN